MLLLYLIMPDVSKLATECRPFGSTGYSTSDATVRSKAQACTHITISSRAQKSEFIALYLEHPSNKYRSPSLLMPIFCTLHPFQKAPKSLGMRYHTARFPFLWENFTDINNTTGRTPEPLKNTVRLQFH
jgi:hypothetical protein